MTLASEIEEFLTHLGIEKGLSKNTVIAYRRDLEKLQKNLALKSKESAKDIVVEDIFELISFLRMQGLAESSITRAVVSIRNFVEFNARENRRLNPIKDFQPPKIPKRLPKALTVEEIHRLIEHSWSESDPITIRDRAIVELIYATGGRVSEIMNLNLSDVLQFDGELATSIRLLGKGKKERVVPIGKYAQGALNDYLVRIRPGLVKKRTDALFLNSRGERLTRQSVWNIIHHAASAAHIDREVTPHSLRHSFATHLLDGGADIRVVQELLGHSSVTTTQIYTLVTIDKLRESYSLAHPRARN